MFELEKKFQDYPQDACMHVYVCKLMRQLITISLPLGSVSISLVIIV